MEYEIKSSGINVHKIIKKYLREHKYNGFYNKHFKCFCTPSDMLLCVYNFSDCKPGYFVKNCKVDGGYCISPKKDTICKGECL